MTTLTDQTLVALRAHKENTCTDSKGRWGVVYLDNAKADLSLTSHQFAGCLSQLAQRGLYREVEEAFGEVLLAD